MAELCTTTSPASLHGKRILLGVTGGIAAYKAAELVRRLKDEGADVRVVMTKGAREFVTPLTFQAVSGNPVGTDLLDPAAEAAMGHIELARWAELVLIAPASADVLAKLAAGLADDLLTTLVLATAAPVLIAPAMNQQMYAHPATQANLATLKSRGVLQLGPASGNQACGEVGPGRLLEPLELVSMVSAYFVPKSLLGRKIVITAGPTREPIDPVRYLSNHSSGKMGYALAEAAAAAGAEVVLVSGPVSIATPPGVRRLNVDSAAEMHAAVMREVADSAIFIGCAAVADYRLATVASQKIKKTSDELELKLVKNPDILAEVSALARRPFCVGFAAETEQVLAHAESKLQRKKLDMICANDVSQAGLGFGCDDNAVTVLIRQAGTIRQQALPAQNKRLLARALIALIADEYRQRAG
ncbi:MAG: bifunctional phosphopantothenoylcysteine decarboxylase/phosphopantothenate--cysteine ligase CoaBC [Pseudomonadota bacterium]